MGQLLLQLHVVLALSILHWLVKHSLEHALIALDLVLAVGNPRHVSHDGLLSFLHQLFAFDRVHLSDLEVVFFVLLQTSLHGRQVVINHQSVDGMVLLGLQLEDTSHCELKSHATHQTLNDVLDYLDQIDLIDQDSLLFRAESESSMLSNGEFLELLWVSQYFHVILECGWELR